MYMSIFSIRRFSTMSDMAKNETVDMMVIKDIKYWIEGVLLTGVSTLGIVANCLRYTI